MTEQDKLFYDEYFTRYGSPCSEVNRTIYFYMLGMEHMNTTGDIMRADKSAKEHIERFENYIRFLKLYRQELADTYNHLMTDRTFEVVKFTRERRCYGDKKVKYYLRFFTRYENGKESLNNTLIFEGTKRHEAIKEFNKYIKDHPDAIIEKDIEKGRWEK